jgi:Mrp family chromosome partitioning ATPase
VIVVDANFRRPAVADRLGISAIPGMREVVSRTASIKQAIKETGQANLSVLPAGDSDFQKAGWPLGEALRGTLHQLRSQFDWILVDAPSWDGGPEMVALCSACDAIFLVLRSKDIDAPVVDHLSRLIPHLGSQLGGYIVAER